jgi:hypothetical protein
LVEDHDVEELATADPAERFHRRPGLTRVHPPNGRLAGQDVSVRRVVVHDQHAFASQRRHRSFERARWKGRGVGLDREPEDRALAGTTLDRHRPTHEFDQTVADRESQTGAPVAPSGGRVHLAERLEQSVPSFLGDADAGVSDGEGQPMPIVRLDRLRPHGDDDLPPLGELHRVVQQVDQDLPQPGEVSHHAGGRPRVEVVGEVEALLSGGGSHQLERRLDASPEVERCRLELEPAGLDLREVEDIVDHAQQSVAAAADDLREVPLLGCELGIEEEPGHADDSVERCADLVAHRRQERALGLGGGLGLLPRALELADVVVEPVQTHGLATDDHRSAEQFDVDQGPVLARPLRDQVDELAAHTAFRPTLSLNPNGGIGGDQIVDVPTDSFLGRIVEQPLGGGVPGRDGALRVHQHDRVGAPLDERLVVALLALDLADVVVDHAVTDPLIADEHLGDEHLHVHEGAVLSGTARDHANLLVPDGLRAIPSRFLPDLGRVRNELVEVGSDCLLGRVTEETLGAWVPRGDPRVLIDSNDRGRAEREDRLEPPLLPLNLGDVVVDDVEADLLSTHRHRRYEELDVHQRTVAPRTPGDGLDLFTASRRLRDGERLVVKLRGRGDEIVEDTANGILGHVAEQSLSARIP